MNTEEKAKAYDEALKTATQWIKDGCSDKEKICLESIFPELRESEDERIRARLIEYFQGFLEGYEDCYKDGGCVKWEGLDVKSILAWLEKQKENPKSADSFTDGIIEVRSFQRGIEEGRRLERQKEQPTDAKSERVIKAARSVLNNWLDGTNCPDVSGDFGELEYAIREYDGEEKQKEQDKCPEYCVRSHCIGCPIYEKQKEPEDVSASTMIPSCWDVEQKEHFRDATKMVEQKPAEYIPDSVKFEEGFKTGREVGFREGVESVKPAEWSEEDEIYLQDALWCVEKAEKSCKDEEDKGACWSAKRWLKSLRPSWKPSEEQMKALCSKLPVVKGGGDKVQDILEILYDDLKKLM